MASCSQWFYAEDQDGNYPSAVNPEFVLKNYSTGAVIGSYTIPSTGRKLTLDSSIRYKAIPILSTSDAANWIRPSDVIFYGCAKDLTFVWEKIICTAGAKKCIGDDVYVCSTDGTEWRFSKNCPGGCSGGECIEPSVDNGFTIRVSNALVDKTITVGHVVKIIGTDLWYWPQNFGYVGGQWYFAKPATTYRIEVGSIFETIPPFNKTYGTGSFADGIHCVVLAEGASGVNTLVFKDTDVFQLFANSPTEINLSSVSNDVISEALMGPVCDFFGISRGSACNSFWAEFSDPVFIANYVSILKTGKDTLGNSRELGWFDHLALPFAILGVAAPTLPVGAFVSKGLMGLTRLGLKFSDAALGWMRTAIVQRPLRAIKPNFEPTPIGFFNAITQLTRAHAEEVLTAVSRNDFALAASKLNGYFLMDYGKAPIADYKDMFQALRNGLNNDEAFAWILEASGFGYPSISAVLNTLQKVTPSAGELSDVSKVMDDAGILGDVATTVYDTLKTLGTATDEMVGYIRNVLKNSPTVSTHVIAKHKTILDKIIAGTGSITKDETLAILNHGKVAPDGIHTMISSLDTTRLIPKLADGNYKQVLGNFIDLTDSQYDNMSALGKTKVDEWVAGNAKIAEDAIGSADPLKMSNLACDAQKATAETGKIIDDVCGSRP